ncbi:MAG: PilW family protein [Gammaproteobacteria bacterium]|jgi:type IV pilus assembly protein PilW
MPLTKRHYRKPPRQQRGFSLIELMVALVITLILLAGIGQIYLGSKKSFTIQNSLGRQQENGRYAAETIAQDLRRAGYWGGNADVTAVTGTEGTVAPAATCNTGDNTWGRMLEQRIFGLNNDQAAAIANYACVNDGNGYGQGDVVVMRFAAPWVIGGATTPAIENNGHLYIRSALTISEEAGRVFKGVDESDTTNDMTNPPAPSERTSELIARAYYVGPSGQTCQGTDVPSLYRENLNDSGLPVAEEIAYGIDQLQVQYGLDTNDDNSVDSWLDAGDAGLVNLSDWDNVIAARFWVLTRAECPETGYTNNNTYEMGDLTGGAAYTPNDGYRRQLYTMTVRLRNL